MRLLFNSYASNLTVSQGNIGFLDLGWEAQQVFWGQLYSEQGGQEISSANKHRQGHTKTLSCWPIHLFDPVIE